MPFDQTQQQSHEEQQRAQQLSMQRTQPPTSVPGYETQRFLGSGAYGEVWVGLDQNTGRRVAIKFYTHRGGVDWSLLSREVEKLVFLSADRYVVQLLDVGWDAEPPYYVMEYVENGSVEDLLRDHGPLSVRDTVDLFREVAVGLLHAHGKGVLHCDLKPANILLDQDHKPRLADFGQSRLSHEQTPALGTLFYMAPEQADLEAVPDARWDVYGLGAILYAMLTGQPPYRNETSISTIETAKDLPERLERYRTLIRSSPQPTRHRRVPGIDRALVEIVDTCLAADPRQRYANVQSVLDALEARDAAHYRLPLMVLGLVGPVLLLLIMGLFAWRGYNRAMVDTDAEVRRLSVESNRFAAKAVAGSAAEEIHRYFHAVQHVAEDERLQQLLAEALRNPQLETLLAELQDPSLNDQPVEARQQLLAHDARQPLQRYVDALMHDARLPEAASWFVSDPRGTQVASVFDVENPSTTVGHNFAWRTYFHGGPDDLVRTVQDGGRSVSMYGQPEGPIEQTHVSAPFQSTATNRWKVAVSTPIYDQSQEGRSFLGIVALTVDIGIFMHFDEGSPQQFAVLVDGRPGAQSGMILQHPLFDRLLEQQQKIPDRFASYRVALDQVLHNPGVLYRDPLAEDPAGESFRRPWVAARAPVIVESTHAESGERQPLDTGLVVLVQEDYSAIVDPVHDLGRRLVREALLAFIGVVCVVVVLWYFVLRLVGGPVRQLRSPGTPRLTPPSMHSMTTLPGPGNEG